MKCCAQVCSILMRCEASTYIRKTMKKLLRNKRGEMFRKKYTTLRGN